MTCIVALECSDGGVIGGDFCGSNGYTYSTMVPPKVFEHSGMMFGYTSTFRFGQLLEHALDNKSIVPPHKSEDTYRWLVTDFVPKLKAILKNEEYNMASGCNAALLVNGQAWELQDELSVLRNDAGLVTVGSGTYHAQSSVLTQLMINHPNSRPTMQEAEEILKIAFNVTSSFVTTVSSSAKILQQPFV